MNRKRDDEFDKWALRQPYSWKVVLVLLVLAIGLAISAKRTEIDRGIGMSLEGVGYALGINDEAEVSVGWNNFIDGAFPLVLAERTATARIENFDPDNLPLFAYLEKQPVREYSAETNEWTISGEQEFLVEPLGYLTHVLWKMLETMEMALWGTLLAIVLAIPLAFLGSKGYSWNRITYSAARGACSFSRALPELILAIFLVLLFGFGTLPGVIALGLHCCGFLGKFFADDIENVDRGPQDALKSCGANRIKVLWYAVLPQAMPQFVAYVQYILERNVRTATVLGIVGAGGIGLELKGRLDLSDYSHVTTILLVIFLAVFLLEQVSQRIRSKIIGK